MIRGARGDLMKPVTVKRLGILWPERGEVTMMLGRGRLGKRVKNWGWYLKVRKAAMATPKMTRSATFMLIY